MLTLPKKHLLALEAVLYIAMNARSLPISSKELAEHLGFPLRYLEQVLQKLVHEGILRGVRGPRGGYVLARERRRVTLADICEALGHEDEDAPMRFGSDLGKRLIHPLLQEAQEAFLKSLQELTLDQLCNRSPAKPSKEPAPRRTQDFTI